MKSGSAIGGARPAVRGQPIPFERPIGIAIVAAALAFAVWQLLNLLLHWDGYTGFTGDFAISIECARRWFNGDGFYLPFQFTGPYGILPGAELYPPPMLLLYLPWLVLPAVLWWVIPIGIASWVVWSWRPRLLAWAGIAICLAFPTTLAMVYLGNPGLWFVAATALATRFGWPGALILLKPTLAPFALLGIWRRSWWIALAGIAIAALVFLPMWPQYVAAMGNFRPPVSPWFYSISQVPTMYIPVLAWLGRTREPAGRRLGWFAAFERLGSRRRVGSAIRG